VNRDAKHWLQQRTGAALPVLLQQARLLDNKALRRAVLWRMADRLSPRNPIKLALQTEAKCM